jgi:tetratricopeptide (TPR) repeat protein
MKFNSFSKIDLPLHHEGQFINILLGADQYRKVRKAKDGENRRRRTAVQKMLLRARDFYFRGFYHDGLTNYARVLSYDERELDAWIGQIRILVDVGRHESAIYWADRALQRFGEIDLIRNAKAFALASGGMIGEAKEVINVPVGADEIPMIWLLRGEVFLKIRTNFIQKLFTPHKSIGRMGAFFCFLRALSSEPNDSFINQRIGLAYLLAGDAVRAQEHLIFSSNVVPDNPLTLYGLARCYAMNKDYDKALSYAKRSIAGNPKLDCAFELMEWLHKPRLGYIGELLNVRKKGRR